MILSRVLYGLKQVLDDLRAAFRAQNEMCIRDRDDSNIMAFIRKLRKKIEPNPDAPEYILTIWGIGYKFSDGL